MQLLYMYISHVYRDHPPVRVMPVTHAPSFDPTIYPFQLILTLSTSTPPSTLTLPRHYHKVKVKGEANSPLNCQSESIQSEDIKASRAYPGNGSGMEVANPR
jgi:hypothetical protein